MALLLNALRGISFFCLAAICKAIADTLAHHFDTSVFKRLNRNFWDPNTSTTTAKILPLTKYKLDAWHLANSFEIVFEIFAMVFFSSVLPKGFWYSVVEVGFYGLLWNIVFNTFYNKILR